MKSEKVCTICLKPLSGRQTRFCSRSCKNADTNFRHQSYTSQQARGARRKLQLVTEAGGRCSRCGYGRNLAALAWHHRDSRQKLFTLDLRSLSNRSEREIRKEIAKCALLCANCHAETHWPQFDRGG